MLTVDWVEGDDVPNQQVVDLISSRLDQLMNELLAAGVVDPTISADLVEVPGASWRSTP